MTTRTVKKRKASEKIEMETGARKVPIRKLVAKKLKLTSSSKRRKRIPIKVITLQKKFATRFFMTSILGRVLSLFLVFSLSFLSFIPTTNAYYTDTETSLSNTFIAAMLDFALYNNTYNDLIGPEALGERSYSAVAIPEDGSLGMQYILGTNITNNDNNLCDKLTVEAKLNGISKYSGSFTNLFYGTTTEFGSWEFRFDLPPNAIVSQGDKCSGETALNAWRQDVLSPVLSGYDDSEKATFNFTARMVVLNEIFANPNGGPAPKNKEFIELYNGSDTPVDVDGWKVSDMAGTNEIFYTISLISGAHIAQPASGSTIIPAGGFMLLNMSDSSTLNNSGDIVRLYDQNDILQDIHTYPAVAPGKSVMRFPDGIGFWIDPDPTPGETNIISIEDLKNAGFNDETIAEILELAKMKNATLISAPEEGNIPQTPDEVMEDLNISKVEDKIEESTTTENIIKENISTTTEEVLNNGTTTPNILNNNQKIESEINLENSTTTDIIAEDIATSTEEVVVDESYKNLENSESSTETEIISNETEIIPPFKSEEIENNQSETLEVFSVPENDEQITTQEKIVEVVAKEEDVNPESILPQEVSVEVEIPESPIVDTE